MARAKPWFHMPCRFHDDERYLDLEPVSGLAFHRMYRVCDRWGRGPAGKHALSALLRMSPTEVVEAREELADGRLISLYDSTEGILCWQLERYDSDCPGNTTTRRAPSDFDPSMDECGQVATRPHKPKLPETTTVAPSSDRARAEIERESLPTEGLDAHARESETKNESETQPPAPRTSPGDTWQPISPPPPPQQPTPPDGWTTEQPATEPPPPLCERGRAVVADLERRMLANPFGEGMLHPRGFFGDGGPMDLEHRLRVLQRDNWEAYDTACRAFWAEVSKTRNNNWWPRDPVRELNSWLTGKGHTVSPALSLMRAAVGGRDGRA